MTQHDQIDADFRTFARDGDTEALSRVFDATSDELYRFALHLCGAPATAEDAVQATWLAAIESADQHDETRPVMPWLTGILHHRVRQHQRRESVRRRPVEPRSDTAVDPALEAERKELSAALDAGIAQLSEVYGPVVKLHLRHGLNANAIAETLGRPAGTVRTQLVRGLDKLRGLLPASLAGAAAALALPSRGLSAVRTEVLQAAATKTAAGAVATTSSGWLVHLALGACALLVVGGVVWAALPSSPDATQPTPVQVSSAIEAAPTAAEASTPADLSSVATRSPAATATPEIATASVTISGRVIANDSDVGLQDVEVLAFSDIPTRTPSGWDRAPRARTRTRAGGMFTLDVPPGPFALHALGEDLAMGEGVGGTTSTHEQLEGLVITMRPSVEMTFTVLDPFGRPLAEHAIELNHSYGTSASLQTAYHSVLRQGAGKIDAVTDRNGEARIMLPEDVNYFCVVPSSRYRPVWKRLDLKSKRRCVLQLEEGDALLGRVTLHDGRPAVGARVRLSAKGGRTTRTDERGEFALRGIETEEKSYLSIRHPDAAAYCLQPLTADGTQLSIELEAPLAIEGRVVDDEGAPIEHAVVGIVGDRRIESNTRYVGETTTWEWANDRHRTKTDEDGMFTLAGLYDGEFELTVARKHLDLGAVRRTVRSIETQPFEIVISEDAVRGSILCGQVTAQDSGEPVADAKIRIYPEAGGRARTTTTNEKGAWEFTGCGEDRFNVEIRAPGFARYDLTAAAQNPAQPIATAMLRTVNLKLRLLAADGSPVGRTGLSLNCSNGEPWMFPIGSGGTSEVRTDEQGIAEMVDLPADLLELTIRRRGEDTVTRPIDLRHGTDTEQTITLDQTLPVVFFQVIVAAQVEGAPAEGPFLNTPEARPKFIRALQEGKLVDVGADVEMSLSIKNGRFLCTAKAEHLPEEAPEESEGSAPPFAMTAYATSMSYPGGGMHSEAHTMPLPTLQLRGRQTHMQLVVRAPGCAPHTIAVDGSTMSTERSPQQMLLVLLSPE